jgi:hypothetical protein
MANKRGYHHAEEVNNLSNEKASNPVIRNLIATPNEKHGRVQHGSGGKTLDSTSEMRTSGPHFMNVVEHH